jgi:pyruvate dehydrogenase E2 component (dihydrolipoamide acetyltransferase)
MARLASVLKLPGDGQGARLIAWRRAEGERVARGEAVAEVELSGERVNIALDDGGTLLRQLAVPGDWITRELAVAIVGEEGEDVSALLAEGGGGGEAPQPGPAAAGTALAVLPPRRIARPMGPADHVDRPLSPDGVREIAKITAARLDIPRIYARADADLSGLITYCERVSQMIGRGFDLRPIDLTIKAAAVALRRVPQVNASYLGHAIRFFTRIHIGLMVAAGEDVVSRCLRDADLKNLASLSREARDLGALTQAGERPHDDGLPPALAVCDLGALGIDHADLSGRPPETAILTLGRLRREPVVEGDRIRLGTRAALTLGCDERIARAPIAARLLGEIVAILEHPESLAL